MEPWTQGIRSAFKAFAGGDQIEAAAAAEQQLAMQKALLARARTDRAVAEAAMAADKQRNLQFLDTPAPAGPGLSPLQRALILGEAAGDWSQYQSGRQTELENVPLESAVEAFQSGAPVDPDWLNRATAIRAGKLLGPANVDVQDQSSALIAFKEAQEQAALARAGASGAREEKTRAEIPYVEPLARARMSAAELAAEASRGRITDSTIKRRSALTDAIIEGADRGVYGDPEAAAAQRKAVIIGEEMAAAKAKGNAAPPIAPKAAAPYAEGTRLFGPDGKVYVVRGGQPVLE